MLVGCLLDICWMPVGSPQHLLGAGNTRNRKGFGPCWRFPTFVGCLLDACWIFVGCLLGAPNICWEPETQGIVRVLGHVGGSQHLLDACWMPVGYLLDACWEPPT